MMNLSEKGVPAALQPAFPVKTRSTKHGNTDTFSGWGGLTIRDYFAAAALQGILAADTSFGMGGDNREFAASTSYKLADAMLAERSKDMEEQEGGKP